MTRQIYARAMAQHLAEKVTEPRIKEDQAQLHHSGAAQGPSGAIGRTPHSRGPHRIGKGLNTTSPGCGWGFHARRTFLFLAIDRKVASQTLRWQKRL
jgi:hypothetical protein